MPGKRFDTSDDPTFDLRAAEIAQAATVQQQAADASDDPITDLATPQGAPGDDDPGTLEQIGNDLGSAAEDLLLAGLAAAPPLAAVAAVVDKGEQLLEAAEDGAKWVGGALDDVGGLFTVDQVVVGESTFPVDPKAVPMTREEVEAKVAAIMAEGDAVRANQERFDELGGGNGYVFNADPNGIEAPLGDIRLQDTTNLDDQATTHAAPDLLIASDIAGPGAAAGAVTSAPDGVTEPVTGLNPDVAIGAAGDVMGAPDGVMEPVTGLSPDVAIGALGATDVDQLPTADYEPVDVPPGADVQLNPQPIPPGADLYPPGPIIDELDAVGDAPAIGADVQLNPQPIPPGMGADIGAPVAFPPGPATIGADVQLNPQPVPPGADLHPPGPIIDELDAAGAAPAIGADVQLNPQPIPPGMGADIGEPLAGATAADAPSVGDASIIIVGGAEASVLAGDTPELAPADDIASTLADDADGPSFRAHGIDEAQIDVGITEDEFDG